MGLLCDYFAAASDAEAASTIDWIGGPARPPTEIGHAGYAVVPLPGVEPTVMMGSLEELLTGRAFIGDILKDPSRKPVASRDGGERLVIPLGPRMDAALASASDERLQEVAVPWSQTEELWGQGDAEILAGGLLQLAKVARGAAASGRSIYCWLSV